MRRSYLSALFVFGAVFLCAVLPIYAETLDEQRARLQQELNQLEADIVAKKGDLTQIQAQRTTLERDVAILDNKISQAQLSIKHTDLSLRQLHGDITEKEAAISEVNDKIDRAHASLAQLIRGTNEIDQTSLVELTLAGSMRDLMSDVDTYNVLQGKLNNAVADLNTLKDDLSARKKTLEDQQNQEETLRKEQVLEKQVVEQNKVQKNKILTKTKGQEAAYQKVIATQEATAADIRAALFGLRDSAAISFGTAYQYAKEAGTATGVRPALILAILTQESNLGRNVGSCYLKDSSNGSGVGKNTGTYYAKVMKAPRDTEPFLQITNTLGISWSDTPVSCPQGSGYGGAMGPSQFIASTWLLYKDQLTSLTGTAFPDPWDARTAIFAAALLMKDNGGDGGTRTAERTAALRYFAGANWAKRANAFYGDSVMELVDNIQSQINILEGT